MTRKREKMMKVSGKWNWSGLSKERHDHFDLYGSKTILKSVHFTSQWVHK